MICSDLKVDPNTDAKPVSLTSRDYIRCLRILRERVGDSHPASFKNKYKSKPLVSKTITKL